MKRPFSIPAMLAVATLVACGGTEDTAAPEPVVTPDPIEASEILTGIEAYERVCANCHESGIDGAPRTGDPDAWVGRSPLWEAVLFEHARSGYIDMPAKGGVEALEDNVVSKAAEYMLMQTFPEARPSN